MTGNLEIVRGIYDAWAKGDFSGGAADLDPEVVFVVRPPYPDPGVFHGPGAVKDYMLRFLAQWEHYAIDAERYEEAGDTILVYIRQRGTGKGSGVESEIRTHTLFTFRGDRIIRIENVIDEGEALKAAGLSG